MSFIRHEDRHWPVALTVTSGSYTLRQHKESLKQWNSWFDKKEPIYVIRVFLDNEAIQHSEDIGQSTIQWMKYVASRKIKLYVKALLIVVPEEQYDATQDIKKIFGVPGGIFTSLDIAFNYLQQQSRINDNPPVNDKAKEVIKQCVVSNSAK